MPSWQYQAELIAKEKMKECWQLWGGGLKSNCLPVCLTILNEVKKSHPNAKVVVGDFTRNKSDNLKNKGGQKNREKRGVDLPLSR